ncbi:MAG: hypothetical protein Q8O67_16580 [Deltaproteobacteria bacterium]|nr:hypothetical protein [Deltaproteobacteria bacterium]
MRALIAAAAAAVVVVAGCSPAPVSAFEDFYQATVRKDVVAFRGLLCDQARNAVAAVDDATLLQTFAVTRVVQRVSVLAESDERVLLGVQDATGQHTTVTLERSLSTRSGWCISGLNEAK